MTDWVHCNKCFLRFRKNSQFYVTTCGHIKCQLCVSKMGPENRCLICSALCEMVALSNNLQPDIQKFFRPAVGAMENSNQVCAFQQNNALSLLRHVTTKYTACKVEIAKGYKIINELKKEQHRLKVLLKSVSRGSPYSRGSSSMMSGNNTTGSRGLSITPMGSLSMMSGGLNASVMSEASSTNSLMQFENSNPSPRVMPWNQPGNAAQMIMRRQYPSDFLNLK